ncbi:hypothetical protein [Streptomyces sp. CBMA152]|uniref:hypothetical protein n=1 Tax=Streptomyces sp. CBMA152 TaxID=1896312 RepID=UPI00166151A3|nr:hypothetical protein [Streptomyces sp. CBMA152]MBD0743584.1 hypothetical protein [Streptomyces sp. CBMA152]
MNTDTTGPAPAPAGPTCSLCGQRAAVNWRRRLTDDEFTAHLALEQERRDERLLLADKKQPVPDFGPMPEPGETLRTVYGCVNHAISRESAALIHSKTCTAPAVADLPGCNCTPEPAPAPEPDPTPQQLPPGWD